jgi:hypothetical protein
MIMLPVAPTRPGRLPPRPDGGRGGGPAAGPGHNRGTTACDRDSEGWRSRVWTRRGLGLWSRFESTVFTVTVTVRSVTVVTLTGRVRVTVTVTVTVTVNRAVTVAAGY